MLMHSCLLTVSLLRFVAGRHGSWKPYPMTMNFQMVHNPRAHKLLSLASVFNCLMLFRVARFVLSRELTSIILFGQILQDSGLLMRHHL